MIAARQFIAFLKQRLVSHRFVRSELDYTEEATDISSLLDDSDNLLMCFDAFEDYKDAEVFFNCVGQFCIKNNMIVDFVDDGQLLRYCGEDVHNVRRNKILIHFKGIHDAKLIAAAKLGILNIQPLVRNA